MNRISLLIAVPDASQRERLSSALQREPDMHVLAVTNDLMNTYNEVESRAPSAVLIDDRLAAQPEFEVMRGLFSALDVRWLIISGSTGAARPSAGSLQKSGLFAVSAQSSPIELAQRIREVTRSSRQSSPRPAATAPATAAAPTNGKLILIGSSTGGVDALMNVLSAFPANCPPTLIVQHTGGGFGTSLVRLLDRQCAASVTLAADNQPLAAGRIVVAAGTKAHLMLAANGTPSAGLSPGAPVNGHMPSVDALFESALPVARRVVAAILTGMGRDGAQGMKALADRGAVTIAQDQATSVVYGMPRAACELGAAQSSLPLQQIGPAILRACQGEAGASRRIST